jgi:hypothetical protein
MRLDRKARRCSVSFDGCLALSIESLMADRAVPFQSAVSVKTNTRHIRIQTNGARVQTAAKES